MIQGLKAPYIDSVWTEVWAVLHRAFQYSDGEFSKQTVYNGIKAKEMQLWLDVESGKIIAAGVTQIKVMPQRRTCWILGFTSESSEQLQAYHRQLEDWARLHKCDEVRLKGRKGWERRAKDFGYELRHVEMAKQLGE